MIRNLSVLTWIAFLALWGCESREPEPAAVRGVSAAQAARLFREHCVICHGERGDGLGARRASLFKKPPDFRDTAWRAGKTPSQVRRVIREGVPQSDMPSWRRLGEGAITGLADYVLSLSNEDD